MKKVSANAIGIGILVGISFFISHCRAEQTGSMSEAVDSGPEADWYGMDGDGTACAAPPAQCASFDYEKEFVDLCIEKSGKAKTCGCAMRCSVKLDYTRLIPAPGKGANLVAESKGPSKVCSEQEWSVVKKVIDNRRIGSDEDRCIEDFFCQGTQERCQLGEISKVSNIRQVAKNGCGQEALNGLCRNGFQESLQCPNENIKLLTQVLRAQSDKNDLARRCTRNVLCFESEISCDSGQKAAALKYKKLLNKDGCEYWLRKLCSLDN